MTAAFSSVLRDLITAYGELTADHVIAATGYRPDLSRLTFLNQQLRQCVRTVAETAVVDRNYRSPFPGFTSSGRMVAPNFGPVMRFVYGSDHVACTVTRHLALTARSRPHSPVSAVR